MKKTLLLLVGLLIAGCLFAQPRYERNIFGVRGGINVSATSVEVAGVSKDLDSRVGFHVGISDQILLSRHLPLYIETGLSFSQLGGKFEGAVDRPLYLQIPLLINYHFNIGDKVRLIPFGGTYFGVGIAGQSESATGEKKDCFGDDALQDRFDVGVRLGFGVEWRRIFFGVNYDLGCYNILNEDIAGGAAEANNNCFSVSIGYNF